MPSLSRQVAPLASLLVSDKWHNPVAQGDPALSRSPHAGVHLPPSFTQQSSPLPLALGNPSIPVIEGEWRLCRASPVPRGDGHTFRDEP